MAALTGMGTGLGLFMIIAGILLLVSRKKGIVAYRWACVFLALSFVGASTVRLTVAVILLLTSFGLRTNVSAKNLPAWMCKGAWTLAAMGFMAVNVVDQILVTLGNFSVQNLMVLVVQAAMILLLLTMRVRDPYEHVVKPRLQAVPADGKEKVLSLIGTLMLIYVIFEFVLGVKFAAGMGASQQFSHALNVLFTRNPLSVVSCLVAFIPDLVACGLLLSVVNRKKHYLLATGLLALNRIPLVDDLIAEATGVAIGGISTDITAVGTVISAVFVLVFLSALGVTWNKKLFGRIPVINFVALLMTAVMLLSCALSVIEDSKSAVVNTKASIYNQVKGAYHSAVYQEAYDRREPGSICNALYESDYEKYYQPAYDAAYKVAYDKFYAEAYDYYYASASRYGEPDVAYVKERAERSAKNDAEEVAYTVANNLCNQVLDGLAYEVYDAVVGYTAVTYSEEFAVDEVYNGKKPENMAIQSGDVNVDIRDAADAAEAAKNATKYRKEAIEQLEYENAIYQEAYDATDAIKIYNESFDNAYTMIYNELYDPCVEAGLAAANEALESRKGDVLDALLNVLLPAICNILALVALALMNTCLTVQEGKRLPNNFAALLDWCYTNVGEKMQKCMKALGAVYLAIGMITISGFGFAVAFFFRGQFLVAAVMLGVAIIGTIVTAANILMTYPMFSFAQMTADIHHIRAGGGIAAAPAQSAVAAQGTQTVKQEERKAEPACKKETVESVAPAAEAPAEETAPVEEDEDFDDLPDL